MRKINYNHHFYTIGIVLISLIFTPTPVSDFNTQYDLSQRETIVVLKANARKNGYKVTVRNNTLFIALNNVIDPDAKKKYNGRAELRYRCKEPDPLLTLMMNVANGYVSGVELLCPGMEPAPGQTLELIKADLILLK